MKCNECKGRKRIELFSGIVDCDACGGSGEIADTFDYGPAKSAGVIANEPQQSIKSNHTSIDRTPPASGTLGTLEAAIRAVPGVRVVRLESVRVGQVDAHVIGGDALAVGEAIERVRPAGLPVCLEHTGRRWERAVAPDGSAVAVKSTGHARVTFGPGSSRPKLTAEDLDTLASLGPCGAIDNLDPATAERWESNAIVYRDHGTREIRPTTYGYGFMAALRAVREMRVFRDDVRDSQAWLHKRLSGIAPGSLYGSGPFVGVADRLDAHVRAIRENPTPSDYTLDDIERAQAKSIPISSERALELGKRIHEQIDRELEARGVDAAMRKIANPPPEYKPGDLVEVRGHKDTWIRVSVLGVEAQTGHVRVDLYGNGRHTPSYHPNDVRPIAPPEYKPGDRVEVQCVPGSDHWYAATVQGVEAQTGRVRVQADGQNEIRDLVFKPERVRPIGGGS